MQARRQRRNTVLQTYEIIKAMEKEDEEESQFEKIDTLRRQKNAMRLSNLYGRSLNCIKSIKKNRKIRVDEGTRMKQYKFSESALESFKKKVFESNALCEIGALPLLNELTDKYSSIKDLVRSLEFHYKIKFSLKEVASYVHHINAADGTGESMKANMNMFSTMLCRLVDQNRYTHMQSRRKKELDLESTRKKRAEYTLRTYEINPLSEADMTDEALLSGLQELNHGTLRTCKMFPKFFTKLCRTSQNTTVTGGSLDHEKLREFCRYNLETHLTSEEARAIIVYGETTEGSQSLPIDFLVSQLKLISLDRPCLFAMKVVLSKLAERDALLRENQSEMNETKKFTLQVFYEKIDTNCDGSITYMEFYDFLQETGFLLCDHEIETAFSEVDHDGDGVIQFYEFVEIMTKIESVKASPVWSLMKADALESLNIRNVSCSGEEDDEKSTLSQLSHSSSLKSLESSSRKSRNSLYLQNSMIGKHTVSSKNHSVEDTSQHSYQAKLHCENCGRKDHSLEYCDRLCTLCVPFCGRRPKKCAAFMEHLKEKSKLSPQKTKLAPLPKNYTVHARQPQQMSLPTTLIQKFTRSKPGATSSILRPTTPVHMHRAVNTLDNLDAASMKTSVESSALDEQSAVFQGDLTRYVQVGLTHLPLASKANYLRYELKWKLTAQLVKELRGRKIKIADFMTKLRLNALGFGGSKRNLKVSDKGTPMKPPLDVKDPLGKFGLWLTRQQILNTFAENNLGGSLKHRQYLCSCLDPRKRGGIPCHEIVALLTLMDTLMYGKHKVDLTKEKRLRMKSEKTAEEVSEILGIVFDAMINDLNAYCEMVYIEEKNAVIGSIDTLKHRKELLDLAGVDSAFIDGVMAQKKEELKGKRFVDYMPEGLIEATMCTFATSYDAEMMILSYVEAMIASRAKRAALEKMSFEVARPEKLEYQEIPKSYVLEYIARAQSYIYETVFEEWRSALYIGWNMEDDFKSNANGKDERRSNDQNAENDDDSLDSNNDDFSTGDASGTSRVSIETLTTMTYT